MCHVVTKISEEHVASIFRVFSPTASSVLVIRRGGGDLVTGFGGDDSRGPWMLRVSVCEGRNAIQ